MKGKAFHSFKLFDGINDGLQGGKLILVESGKIAAIVEDKARARYEEYELIDLQGRTLLPGLIDAHMHITVPFVAEINLQALRQMNRQLAMNMRNCVKYGVTTIRDLGAFPKKIQRWRKKIDRGEIAGPRILTSHSFVTSKDGVPEMVPTLNPFAAYVAGGQFVERLSTPEEVRRVAHRLLDHGADWLKTQYSEESFLFHGRLSNLSDECLMALIEVAKTRKVRVAMHHTEAVGFRKGLQVGVDTLEHCAMDALEQKDVDEFVEKGTAIVPTLKTIGDHGEVERMLDWLHQDGKNDLMPEPLRQSIAGAELLLRKPYPPPDYAKKFYPDIELFRRSIPVTLKNIQKIKSTGGKIGVGTDCCGTGLSFFGFFWKELLYLTRAGLSNLEALKAATSVNAEIIGMEDSVGSIEPDKYADFTIIEGNPLEEIERVRHVQLVVKGGEIIFDRSTAQ